MTVRKNHFATKKAIQSRTPTMARNAFRIVMYLNASITGWLAITNTLSMETKFEIAAILNCFVTPGAHLISKLFGVTYENVKD